MAIAVKEGRAINGVEAVAERPDGTRVSCMAFPSPLRNASGEIVGAVNVIVDISERKSANVLASRLASIVETSDDAIIGKDLNGIITTWNKGAERLFGYAAGEVIGKSVMLLIPIDRRDEEAKILERLCRGERIDHYETIRRRKDGSLVEISLSVSPVNDEHGRIVGASKIARDITERKLAAERIQILAHEVDHRAKNLLALVQATVNLSQAETAHDLKAAVVGRLRAIATAHSMFAKSRWLGADLRRLVAEELAPSAASHGARSHFEGPELLLDPNAAQSISIVLHELTTNAVKYGALSDDTGTLGVSWTTGGDGRTTLRWSETGGPVVATPSRRGFGTRVMEQLVRDQIGGDVTFDWRPEGLLCEIALPAGIPAVGQIG